MYIHIHIYIYTHIHIYIYIYIHIYLFIHIYTYIRPAGPPAQDQALQSWGHREIGKGGMRKGGIGQVDRNAQQTNTHKLDFPIPFKRNMKPLSGFWFQPPPERVWGLV